VAQQRCGEHLGSRILGSRTRRRSVGRNERANVGRERRTRREEELREACGRGTMTRHAMLPPFLQKLKMISETVPDAIADWSTDGLSYVVKDSDKFEEVLKQHFKGSLQTFIRQLHFYGFRKLDAHSGGWSFIHKNFRKDKPELVSEIRRKTRSEAAANGAASQVEVQQLRSQVAKLEGVVEDLRTQLDQVLTVLDTAGVVDVVEDEGGKQDVRLPEGGVDPLAGRKRIRFGEDGDRPENNNFNANGMVDVDVNAGVPGEESNSIAINVDNLQKDCGLKTVDETSMGLEPLAVDVSVMEDDTDEEIFDLSSADFFYNQLNGDEENDQGDLVVQLESDLVFEPDTEVKQVKEEQGEAATTAKLVADATELDAASVQKVLGFLKKAIKSDSLSQQELPDLLSFPQLQHAILNYKDVTLPTQEVGAN